MERGERDAWRREKENGDEEREGRRLERGEKTGGRWTGPRRRKIGEREREKGGRRGRGTGFAEGKKKKRETGFAGLIR